MDRKDQFEAMAFNMILDKMLDKMIGNSELTVKPFAAEILVSPFGISCQTTINKKFVEIFGEDGEKWMQETREIVDAAVKEQAEKLAKLIQEKWS